ncbi:MAG: hypothetical protein R6V53_02170 [Candidatus Woesearchaeota archaeon]
MHPVQIKNSVIAHYTKRPAFLSDEIEQELIDIINHNNLNAFYDKASQLINNTRDIANLYIYLFDKVKPNKQFMDQVCWRMFNLSCIGWLRIHDPHIIRFCKKHATDKNLIEELKEIRTVRWFDEYYQYMMLEQKIRNNQNIEKSIKEYYEYLHHLLKKRRIRKEDLDEAIKKVHVETTIYKGKQPIGSLISKKLQEKLGASTLLPKIKIHT